MFFLMPTEISAVLTCFSSPPFFGCSAPFFGCSVVFFGCSGCSWATISAVGVKNSAIATATISFEIIYEFLRLPSSARTWLDVSIEFCWHLSQGSKHAYQLLLAYETHHAGALFRSPCKFLFPKPPAVENWPILGPVLLSIPYPILITFLSWVLPVDRAPLEKSPLTRRNKSPGGASSILSL